MEDRSTLDAPEVSDLALSGFLGVVTHPKIFDPPTPLPDALEFTEALRAQPNCVSIAPGNRHWTIFRRLCLEADVRAIGKYLTALLALAAIDARPANPELAGRFRYSNDGYDLLAILLERLYDRPYEELAQEKVLARACLEAPRFWSEVELTDPAVVGQPLRRLGKRLRRRSYGMLGSAGRLITAADLVRLQHAIDAGRVLLPSSLAELRMPRGEMSLGRAALGAFLIDHPELGRVHSALGYEDWGDNAVLNHYLESGVILAVVTSKGPAEVPGERPSPFRSRIAGAIEELLARDPAP